MTAVTFKKIEHAPSYGGKKRVTMSLCSERALRIGCEVTFACTFEGFSKRLSTNLGVNF